MPRSFSVPMTTATGFGPLPELLAERCGERAVQRVFAGERLPLALIEDRRHLVPFTAMLGVFEQAARRAGNRTFGFDVGAGMSEGSYGVWLDYAGEAPTLGEALRRAVSAIRFHQTVGRLSLDPSGGSVVWRYWPPPVPHDHTQHSDHVIAPMIRMVARYAGPGWQPRAIEVNYPRDPATRALERRTGVPIRFGAPAVGIEIPVTDLGAGRPSARVRAAGRTLTLREVAASSVLAEETEPLRSVRAIVALRLMEGHTGIEGAAAMAGLGVQGLQRRLREAGLSYREIVGAARLARAEALLRETDLTVTEIALELGYNEHANFSRAFRRATGCTPSDFRTRAGPRPCSTA
jgi:AraC-like DNA-binding protein